DADDEADADGEDADIGGEADADEETDADDEADAEAEVVDLREDAAVADANPMSVPGVKPPPTPANAAELLTKGLAVKWLDYAVYQVEKVIVVYMLAMMSVMMFMEMLYLAMVSEDSKLAAFFVGWVNRVQGGELSEASVAIWETWVVRLEVVGFVFLCYFAAATRFKDKSPVFKGIVGVFIGAGCYGFAELVRTQPSTTSYSVLLLVILIAAGAWWFVTPT